MYFIGAESKGQTSPKTGPTMPDEWCDGKWTHPQQRKEPPKGNLSR